MRHGFALFLGATAYAILAACSSDTVERFDALGPAGAETPAASPSPEGAALAPGRIVTVEPTPVPPPILVPNVTPVPPIRRDPLTAEELGHQTILRDSLLDLPSVAQALAPILGGDAATLTSLIRPQVRYCEWTPEDYEPPPVTEANAHLARCPEDETKYEAWPVTLWRFAGRPFSPSPTWTRSGAEELLDIVLAADIEIRAASVEQYRRVLSNGQITLSDRYLITFALGPTDISRWFSSLPPGGPAAFRIQIEAGDPLPIDGIEFLLGKAPRPTALVRTIGLLPSRIDDADDATLAAIREIPVTAAVVDTFTAGDLEATLAMFDWAESGCISPPLPGKEIPEVCDALDLPRGSSYQAIGAEFGTLFPASKQRVEWWMSGLIASDTLVVAAAWRIEGPWLGSETSERIAISFVSKPVSFIERDGDLAYWGDYLDGVWLFVDPGAEHPIDFVSFFGEGLAGAQDTSGYENSDSFRATRLGVE